MTASAEWADGSDSARSPSNRRGPDVTRSLRRPLFLAAAITVAASSLPAAPEPELGRPWIDSWSVADYAARSHQNWDLRQDQQGLVWVGNGGGVQLYDGVRWTQIPTPHSSVVYSLLPAEDGRIYLGTTSDLGYLEPDPNADWRYVSLLAGREDVPQFGNILELERTADGIFFFSSQLIFRYRLETAELRWYQPATRRFHRVATAGGAFFAVDNRVGVYRYEPAVDRLELVPSTADHELRRVTFLSELDGRLLIGTRRGLLLLEEEGLRPMPTAVDDWMAEHETYRGLGLPDGGLAIASRDDGLVLLEADGSLRRFVSRDSGLRWSWVTDLFVDHQGGLWAPQEGGVSRIEIDPMLTYFDEPLGVHSVEALARHRGWLVAATGVGLRRLQPLPEAGRQARWLPLAAQGRQTWSLLDDGDQLLFGESNGIRALRLSDDAVASEQSIYDGRRAVHLTRSTTDPGRVYAALEDGVVRLRRTAAGWRSEGKLEGIETPIVFVEQESSGTLWFSAINGAYYRVRSVDDWPEAEIEHFGADAGVPAGNAHLFKVGGDVTFGTWDGLRSFSGGRFAPDASFPAPLTDGSLDIHRMTEGPDGRLWIRAGGLTGVATRRDAGGFDWDDRPLRRLTSEKVSGLCVDQDGVVWLGRRSGVVRFDPRRWRVPPRLPPVRITKVTVPGRSATLYGGAVDSTAFIASPLEPRHDALRIDYAVADYAPPRQTQYRVWLEGVDRGWSEWTAETRKDYTNLPPGRHTLRVEARNSLGQVAEPGVLRVRRLPPWYRTKWAYLLYGLAGVLLLTATAATVTRLRTARLEAEHRRLEGVVADRTASLRHQAAELAALHRAKSRFFGNVSHELRTPLALTLGPLQDAVSGRHGELPEELEFPLRIALRNAGRLRNLVDQVLDADRLEAGRMPLAAAAGDLGSLVREVAARFASAAERVGLALEVSAVEDGVEVWFDSGHLERVMSNLLDNAIKHTPAPGRIAVSLRQEEGEAVLAVRDTGVGIDARDLPRVFERYFQGAQASAAQPGTGIGLALVRELVELHGGRMEVESEPGRGSTFIARLLLGRAHLSPDQLAAETEMAALSPAAIATGDDAPTGAGDEEAPPGDATTLLIVDDNAELRAFLRQRFARRYRVIEAGDGVEALDLCRESCPDLLICDVMMPRMDGLELTSALRSDPELDFVPILLLTARTTTDDAVAGLATGADDYLRKPFDVLELEARVERIIASRRQLRARFAAPEAIGRVAGKDQAFDQRLLAAIEEQLGNGGLSVQSLADALAMDRTHLYRRVQAVRGVSPQELIRQIRLQSAARMLASGEGTVTEVAYSVGFKSLGHFSESFRKHYGMTPSKWQREGATAPPSARAST